MPRWTIADVIAAGDTIYANCSDPRCFAGTKLDLDALAARLGPDHGAMHDDLTPLLKCSQCKAEGRPHRRPFLTVRARLHWHPSAQARRRVWFADAAMISVSSAWA